MPAQEVRSDVAIACSVSPVTRSYYVDPTAGNDANDGVSPATAWKTWAPFQATARPGCSLLLKRGETFVLPLPVVGGSAGTPVVYGAYGEGPRPILEANVARLSRSECWRDEGGGIWRTTDDLADVANVILDGSCANMRYSREGLQHNGEWFQHGSGTGPLFVRSHGNPALTWRSVEVIPAGNGITLQGKGHSHVRLQDLHLRKIGTHGIQLIDGVSDVAIRRCELDFIGGAVYRCDAFSIRYGQRFVDRRVRFGNGIETWESVCDVTIEGCRISNIYDGGICIQGFRGSVAENVCVRDNVVWNCGYDSLDVAHGVLTRNVIFEYNTCVNAGEGWALQGEPRPRYSVNIPDQIGFHCNMESSYAWDMGCAITVRHNIFCNAPESRCLNYGPGTLSPTVMVEHNCYFQARAEDAIAQLGKRRFAKAEFAAYVQASGWDKDSIVADPLFMDVAAGDFRLKPGSPCVGMGAITPLQAV